MDELQRLQSLRNMSKIGRMEHSKSLIEYKELQALELVERLLAEQKRPDIAEQSHRSDTNR